MNFISEDRINAAVANAEQDTASQIASLSQQQPMILAYLVSEQFELLSSEEKDYFIYLAWVLHQSITSVEKDLPIITEDAIGQAEEANWEIIEKGNKKDFRKLLDPFFENTTQEDLLAFIEDALVADDEDFVTTAGRELMFVGLKTIVDVMVI